MQIASSALLGMASALYLMKSRKKGRVYISQEKFLTNSSTSNSATVPDASMKAQDNTSQISAPEIAAHNHNDPEGPNIGPGSDPSWLASSGPEKTDLLHCGHSKGGKLVVVMVG